MVDSLRDGSDDDDVTGVISTNRGNSSVNDHRVETAHSRDLEASQTLRRPGGLIYSVQASPRDSRRLNAFLVRQPLRVTADLCYGSPTRAKWDAGEACPAATFARWLGQ